MQWNATEKNEMDFNFVYKVMWYKGGWRFWWVPPSIENKSNGGSVQGTVRLFLWSHSSPSKWDKAAKWEPPLRGCWRERQGVGTPPVQSFDASCLRHRVKVSRGIGRPLYPSTLYNKSIPLTHTSNASSNFFL